MTETAQPVQQLNNDYDAPTSESLSEITEIIK